jgi:VWFA-related protein
MRKFVLPILGTVASCAAWFATAPTPILSAAAAQTPPASSQAARPQPPQPATTSQAPATPVTPVQTPGVPPPTFRVEINYVEVDAVVTDRTGRLVNDLTRDDFEIFEDGKPQKVELFTRIDMPVTREDRPLTRPAPIEPDVKINDPFEGRVYVFLLDDIHTHPMRSVLVRKAAHQFIDRYLGANDMAAVVYTSGRADAGQEFTSNKRLLKAAVDRLTGRKIRSSTLGRLESYNQQRNMGTLTQGAKIQDPDDFERGYNARMSLDTLRGVAAYLEGVRGRRKAVLFFSEGIDYDIYDVFDSRDATTVLDSTRDAIGAATRANVAIYSIDPRGLTSLGDEAMEISNLPEDESLGIGPTGLMNELRRAQDSLKVLAEETGGIAAVNSNDFDSAFSRIQNENSTYYVLGYYPTNDRRDGKFRKLQVKVLRPGMTVRSRKGYVAPKGKAEVRETETTAGTSAVLREALSSPLPEAALPMGIQATAFKGTAPKASVAVVAQFGGRQLTFTQKGTEFLNTIEMSMIAIDDQGKVKGGDRQKLDLTLKPETHQRVLAGGFRMIARIELEPGRYQLRVAARESGGKVGSVLYDLEVSNFWKDTFSMSGLVLTSNAAGLAPTARPDEQLSQVLKTPPSIVRDFLTVETLSLFAEIYDNETKPHTVDITTTLVDEKGAAVFKTEDQRSNAELKGARGGYGYTADIPLKDVAEGRYVLRVEARSRLGDMPVAVRETEVRVYAPRRPAPAPSQQGRAIVPVDRGPMSGVTAYKDVLVRSAEELQAFWGTLTTRRKMPTVTFTNTMLAAVFLGERPTAGYAVEVVGVARDGETLVISYAERPPAADAMVGQVVTTPYVVVGVPMHAGPVKFVKVDPSPGGDAVR